VKRFKPSLVAIRNGALVAELRDAIADVYPKPEIMVGEEGIIEVCCKFVLLMQFSCVRCFSRWVQQKQSNELKSDFGTTGGKAS
jgi:hypothetical protein